MMSGPGRITVAVPVMGKGATNHIHRPEVIDACRSRGIELLFLVRPDYLEILQRHPEARYTACELPEIAERKRALAGFFEYWRNLYPARDPGRKTRFRVLNADRSLSARFRHRLLEGSARSRWVMVRILHLEERLLRNAERVQGPVDRIDRMLLLGVGTHGTMPEALFARWAKRHGIPAVHIVSNYDGLSSKGFRGTSVDRLLVWGPAMRDDAVRLQGIPQTRTEVIGAPRYDRLVTQHYVERAEFLAGCGLDATRKTILFAGGRNAYHYFEALAAFEELRARDHSVQLVIRVYPKKSLLRSAAMRCFIRDARRMRDVYVSIADPHYEQGTEEREVIAIEERELWHLLKHSDLVVNLFSTIALEACLFDKPVINMWYFGSTGMALREPEYVPYPDMYHIRKFEGYGVSDRAESRTELIDLMRRRLDNPGHGAPERRMAVAEECGPLDGQACTRLAQALREGPVGAGAANLPSLKRVTTGFKP